MPIENSTQRPMFPLSPKAVRLLRAHDLAVVAEDVRENGDAHKNAASPQKAWSGRNPD